MSNLNIKVIAGSVREGRFADKAAAWIAEEVKKQEGVSVEIVDLKDYDMPFFNAMETPSQKTKPYEHEAVARFTAKVAEADAFVIVTPEYNHSAPAVLKNAIDWVYQEWNNKPVAFVSYGSVSGARAVEHLRLMAIELQMAPIREAVHIPGEQYFPVLFGAVPADEMLERMIKQSDRMIPQLMWWTKALKAARG